MNDLLPNSKIFFLCIINNLVFIPIAYSTPANLFLEENSLIVTSVSEPTGDYESYKFINTLSPSITIQYVNDRKHNKRYKGDSIIRNVDSHQIVQGHRFSPGFYSDKEGQSLNKNSTAIALSKAILKSLRTKQQAPLIFVEKNFKATGRLKFERQSKKLIILNDTPQLVSVIHANFIGQAENTTGKNINVTGKFSLLDSFQYPITLYWEINYPNYHVSVEVVRIDNGQSIKDRITREIKHKGKVTLYGIHFDFAKSAIRSESKRILNAIAQIMLEKPQLKLTLNGHTDWIGSDRNNQKLSEARTLSVKNYLITVFGIPENRIKSYGYGERNPLPDTDQNTLVGRALNRRVEFIFK